MFFNENSILPFSGYLDPVSAIVGSTAVSGILGHKAAKDSRRSSERGAEASIEEQGRQYDLTRADAAPYRKVGSEALFSLADMMGVKTENPYEEGTPEYTSFNNREKYDFQTSPGYEFRLGEGQKALERSQAGRRLGGRAAKEAIRYGQGYGSDEYSKDFSRLSTLAGYGPPTVGAGMPTGIPGTIERGAARGAAADYAGSQSINQAIQGGLGNYMAWQTYNQQRPRPTPTTLLA